MNITDEMLYAAAPEAAERWLDTLPKREDCEIGRASCRERVSA